MQASDQAVNLRLHMHARKYGRFTPDATIMLFGDIPFGDKEA
jgi:hypothetical protein